MRIRAWNCGLLGLAMFAAAQTLGALRCEAQIFSVANDGPSGLDGDVIFLDLASNPVAGGAGMGAGMFGDDIDAFSENAYLVITDSFLFCLSPDPLSQGFGDPVDFGDLGFPNVPMFNLTDQATKNQAAGDAFLTTEAFSRLGYNSDASLGLNNTVLAINQSETYIDNFGLVPELDPSQSNQGGGGLDDVDGGGTPLSGDNSLYFSMDKESPSLLTLPTSSGAGIIFDPDPTVGGNESLYAEFDELGLVTEDEVDALVVFDDDRNGVLSGTDLVLFSLGRDSPTLTANGWSAADVLFADVNNEVGLFATHDLLGTLATDDINMIVLTPLINNSALDTIANKVPGPGSGVLLAAAGLMIGRRRVR